METYAHCPDDRFIEGDLRMLSHCDGIVLLPNWQQSEGARKEFALAIKKGLLAWTYPSVPPPPENVSGDSE